MAQNRHWEQDKEATVYIGNIDERATSTMVYEIMLQMGPIHNIHMPRDRVTQSHQGFGFVEFRTPADAEYAANVMNGIKLYGKSLRVNKASADKQKSAEVGAELFVGNLDAMVDEKILYDTFSRFGPLLSIPKVAREDSGASKGFGFVSFGDFDSSDNAIANLHGQYLLSKEVSVQYAFKKDGKGERHGDEAERQLAAQAKSRNLIPEAQPLPQAFLINTNGGGANNPNRDGNAGPGPGPGKMAGNGPVPNGSAHTHTHTPSHGNPNLNAVPPTGPAGFDQSSMMAGGPGIPPPNPNMGSHPPPSGFAPPRGPSPYHNAGASHPPPGGFGGMGRGMVPLPPAPTGLPARPPQIQGGYTNPADFHPAGFRPPPGAAPPSAAPPGAPPPQGFPAVPPPGFPIPPPGSSNTPPAPPGFMPPPGFQPPPGFGRR
ncbi:Splicing factor 3B subunit 4 [Escovopsis weberi]|uniref:Splicing factor 3B subunit 4 n=1 Tax=Escovopsis weberi TaxID=150374 RepID=A0A0M9VTC1_ESCWE|nr:Splicing factor 3B subunit 4 [Escovopsis weberi]